jgi:hypothetical protein
MKKIIIFAFWIITLNFSDIYPQSSWIIYPVYTGAQTINDLISYGSPHYIEQDPRNPAYMHAVLVSAPLGDSVSMPNAKTVYYFSSDAGMSWDFLTNVNNSKSNICSVTLKNDGSAFVCNQSKYINSITRVLLYEDAFSGLGSFSTIVPAYGNFLYGRVCLTSDLSSNLRVILLGLSSFGDTLYKTIGYNNWSPKSMISISNPECYCTAKGQDGRIGISYIQKSNLVADYNSVYFIESTDRGQTFSNPIKIYQASFNGAGADSLAAFRGISMVYKGNTPCVTFETVKQDPVSGNYFMKAPAKILFWCSQLQGSDPYRCKTIASGSNVPIPPPDSIKTGVDDKFGSLSRPVIGVSSDNKNLFVVFQAFSSHYGGRTDTTNYKDLYLSIIYYNYTFSTPVRFANSALYDWSFPSISAYNQCTPYEHLYNINVAALRDSIPGTYINSPNNGQSLAKLYLLKLSSYIWVDTTGINNSGQVVSYSLSQNYPNPFNPATIIKFELPKGTFVNISVYDIAGKEIIKLVNKKVSAGSYEVKFDGSTLPSGVYYYKITTDGFSETKKMVLMK